MANALTATGREDPLGPEPLAGMDVADGVAATSAQRIAFESTTPSVRRTLARALGCRKGTAGHPVQNVQASKHVLELRHVS